MHKRTILSVLLIFALTFSVWATDMQPDRGTHEPLSIKEISTLSDGTVRIDCYSKHKKGIFTSSEDFEESITLPEDLRAKNYRLFRREVDFSGKGSLINEYMDEFGYSCKMHLSKVWLGSSTIELRLTLFARNDGQNPSTLDAPQIVFPMTDKVSLDIPSSKASLEWKGEGSIYKVSLLDKTNGNYVVDRTYYSKKVTFDYESLKDGRDYLLTVSQADDSLVFSDPAVSEFTVIWGFAICPNCHGHGEVTCIHCHGQGQWTSTVTGADGQTSVVHHTCHWCHGSGKDECSYCYGKGWVKK
ncbi:MAG: zinc finger-like domain-containing protein [Candidatus Muiribacteriaceae bacterium]